MRREEEGRSFGELLLVLYSLSMMTPSLYIGVLHALCLFLEFTQESGAVSFVR
jgi:hypothetical protein